MEQTQQQIDQPSRAVVALRWIAMLPAAALGGMLAWWLIVTLNRISMPFAGVNPDSLLASIFILVSSSTVFGGAFVYIAAYVAPSHEKQVAMIFAGLLILLAGAALFASILTRDWQSILQLALSVLGAGTVAYERAVNDRPLNEMW